MISNDSVAAFVEWTRGRLVGAGSVDISRPIEAMREIRRCIIDVGFKAMRVPPWLWSVPPTACLFYPVHAACLAGCAILHLDWPNRSADALGSGSINFPRSVGARFSGSVGCLGKIGYPWTMRLLRSRHSIPMHSWIPQPARLIDIHHSWPSS